MNADPQWTRKALDWLDGLRKAAVLSRTTDTTRRARAYVQALQKAEHDDEITQEQQQLAAAELDDYLISGARHTLNAWAKAQWKTLSIPWRGRKTRKPRAGVAKKRRKDGSVVNELKQYEFTPFVELRAQLAAHRASELGHAASAVRHQRLIDLQAECGLTDAQSPHDGLKQLGVTLEEWIERDETG